MSLTEFFLTREIGSEEIEKISRNRGWRLLRRAAVYKLAWGMHGVAEGRECAKVALMSESGSHCPPYPGLVPSYVLGERRVKESPFGISLP